MSNIPRPVLYSVTLYKLEIVDRWSTRIPRQIVAEHGADTCDLDLWPIDLEMVLARDTYS